PQSSSALGAPLATISLGDLAILAACGVAGYYLGKVLRFPAYRLTGPLLLSAAAHVSGLTASKPPGELIILAQLVLGSSIGVRFVGVRLIEMLSTIRIALGSVLILLSLAFVCTYALHTITGIDSKVLLLTLSPGGLAEMTLIALTLGIDVAFITVHHLMRIVMAVFVAPLVFKALKRFLKPQEKDG
ncbi:MAG: AbrB family transcriptional regulator, partial [Proteobacteria bacterium]|nr:AbrB family transcriptional regulator [Pseudomonadota bacterium]